MHPIDGAQDKEARLKGIEELVDQAAAQSSREHPNESLDLIILPEEILTGDGKAGTPAQRAVRLDGPELERMRNKAREHHTYIVVPLTLILDENPGAVFNSAVLLDRAGATAGIYHKAHPVSIRRDQTLEGGITPGSSYPVFACDFGKLGIQICWDMSYEEGWSELARQGAEIIALPSASPQTVRPSSYALRHRYHVVSSTSNRNASVYNPIGCIARQITAPGVLIVKIDLSYAILHWSPTLEEGRSLKRKFREHVDFDYYPNEDSGIFWSNHPDLSIQEMIREMGEVEMAQHIAESAQLANAILKSGNTPT